MLKNPNSTLTNKKPQIDPNRNKWRVRVGVVWHEARRHILLLGFGDWGRLQFMFVLLLRRVAGPCEPSSPVTPLVGGVVLHYRWRNNNGGRRRGGGHERVTLEPTGLYTHRGVRGEAARAGCANHVSDGGSAAASRT